MKKKPALQSSCRFGLGPRRAEVRTLYSYPRNEYNAAPRVDRASRQKARVMPRENVNTRALWGGRLATIAGLLVIMLFGLSSQAWASTLSLDPTSGPGGTSVQVHGSGFAPLSCSASLRFRDAAGTVTYLGSFGVSSDGTFTVTVTIPAGAAVGDGHIRAHQVALVRPHVCGLPQSASAIFTVTSGSPGTQLRSNPREQFV